MNKRSVFLLAALNILVSLGVFAEGNVVHILQKGETLYAVARLYKISPDVLLAWNKIKDPSKLFPGQKIEIPSFYTVNPGDNLYSIARKTGVKFSELLTANGLTEKSLLKPGQKLSIPVSPGSIAAVTPETGIKPPPKSDSDQVKPAEPKANYPDASVSWPCVGVFTQMEGNLGGIIISGREGDTIRSVTSGTVVVAGPYRGWGKVVFIKSKDGHIYAYGGNGSITVRLGDYIQAGTAIGQLALDTREEKALLKFIVYKNGKPIDPAKAPRG